MSIIFAGTSLADCALYRANKTAICTTLARLAPYCTEGVDITYTNDSQGFDTPDIGFQFNSYITDGWISFYLYCGDFTTNNWDHYVFALRDMANYYGSPILMLRKELNANGYRMYYRYGASSQGFTSLGAITAQLHRFDIRVKIHATAGEFTVYMDGVSIFTYTGNTSSSGLAGFSGINGITFAREGGTSGVNRTISAIIAADEDTRAMQMTNDYPTGNGYHTAWTGDYTNVDGTGFDAGDTINTMTAGAKETFTFPNLVAGVSAMTPKAVVLSAYGRETTKEVRGVTRQASTDYDAGVLIPANSSARGRELALNVNPATGIAWTVAEINAAQFGVSMT